MTNNIFTVVKKSIYHAFEKSIMDKVMLFDFSRGLSAREPRNFSNQYITE
jgi:hypothetical protein